VSGIFSEWQPRYAAHRVATFPVEDKRPRVRGWQNVGLYGSGQLPLKFPDAEAFGFKCGAQNGITVIDIDTNDEGAVKEAIRLFGESPILWRTGSGNYAMPFRYNGEKRRIRTVGDLPIDILGEGFVVAPPSLGSKGGYEFLQGSLSDLERLPKIAFRGHSEHTRRREPVATEGERNDKLFRHCAAQALYCDALEDLVDVAKTFNNNCVPPLSDIELVKTARSAWKWTLGGKVRHGMVSVPRPAIESLALKNPDALALFMVLAALNGQKSTFWIANGMAGEHVRLTVPRLARARNELLNLKIIKRVSPPRPRFPALYKWGEGHGCALLVDQPNG
jgi:hypothetical protein